MIKVFMLTIIIGMNTGPDTIPPRGYPIMNEFMPTHEICEQILPIRLREVIKAYHSPQDEMYIAVADCVETQVATPGFLGLANRTVGGDW